ncbi:uncharacterized protein LAJ45_05150 [Morchella importuna]|uniref:Uncharacterized protein n=1 Tax=Morchella conica CCBAS932 TaxID=1392247 RepID=A0A3N4KJT2_9PEZI|nr:uncharacterized protein LAJ45_05150 [Morchella importuna]KAH8150967.1 hypothetical protein LAJ45_05150 [Morchella importuna]RPB10823.1 hypothetical protein P167DRAFT_537342 [Morchella conica CCBAS932]
MADDLLFQLFHFAHSASSYTSTLTTNLYDLLSPLREYAHSQPDLMNIALLLLIVYLSLSILGMASRWIYGVLVTTIRLLFIMFVVVASMWLWQRGGAAKGDLERLAELVGKALGAGGKEWAASSSSSAAGGRDWTAGAAGRRFNDEF